MQHRLSAARRHLNPSREPLRVPLIHASPGVRERFRDRMALGPRQIDTEQSVTTRKTRGKLILDPPPRCSARPDAHDCHTRVLQRRIDRAPYYTVVFLPELLPLRCVVEPGDRDRRELTTAANLVHGENILIIERKKNASSHVLRLPPPNHH